MGFLMFNWFTPRKKVMTEPRSLSKPKASMTQWYVDKGLLADPSIIPGMHHAATSELLNHDRDPVDVDDSGVSHDIYLLCVNNI